MEPDRPVASAVAIASGRIVALGSLDEVRAALGDRPFELDTSFRDRVLDEIGSIRPGKRADFTVLSADPYGVEREAIRDIEIWGTVLDGRSHPIP